MLLRPRSSFGRALIIQSEPCESFSQPEQSPSRSLAVCLPLLFVVVVVGLSDTEAESEMDEGLDGRATKRVRLSPQKELTASDQLRLRLLRTRQSRSSSRHQ